MENRKKIVVIGPSYPFRGGIATFVASLCNLLNQQFDVHLLNYTMLYPGFLFPGKTQYDESEKLVFSFPNTRIFGSLNPFSWIKTAREINRINPDIIIMDWWNPFFSICFRGLYILLNKKYKKQILIVAENVVSHEGRTIDKFLTRIGITIASSYIVLSDKVLEQIAPFAGSKKIYKSNLPIYDQFDKEHKTYIRSEVHENLTKDQYILLFFGYIRKYKGLDIALEAMPSILKKIPNAMLLVVGECYDDWNEYQRLIDDYKLQEHVTVVSSYVSNEEVEKYFQVSDIVLLPYRSATQSGILNIAYGFNKPVIANSVGGFSEFVLHGETGLLVKEVNSKKFAEAVIDFHANYQHLDLVANIKKVRGKNSFEEILKHVEEFGQFDNETMRQ